MVPATLLVQTSGLMADTARGSKRVFRDVILRYAKLLEEDDSISSMLINDMFQYFQLKVCSQSNIRS